MGVVATALATIAGLAAVAWLTGRFELFINHNPETRGPATPAGWAEDFDLPQADRWLHPVAPVVALMGVALAMVVIPFGPELIASDLGIGVFYFIVVVDFVVVGIALGGWGANTSESVEACYRVVAQLVAYVIPLGLAYIGAIMMARSLSSQEIVRAQADLWFVVSQPLGFALYIVTASMQVYRAPFLEPFAPDVRFGVVDVYGGWKVLVWRLALSGLLFVVAAMGAVLFLGGWRGPWLPGPVWMLLKTYGLAALMLWLGRRVSLLSTAQMLALSWKVLIPVGLANVLLVGALILLGVGGK